MRRFLTGWLVCALLCTLCACENAAGQADLQSIQKADVRELYEALYSDVAEAEDTYVGKSYAFLGAVKSLSSGHGVIALKDLGIMLHTAMESEPIFPNRPWESCAVMRWFGLLGR